MTRLACFVLVPLLCLGCGKDEPPATPNAPTASPSPSRTADSPTTADATKGEPTKRAEPDPVAVIEPEMVPELLTSAEIADGWLSLFDGHSLFGWEPEFHGNWAIVDGVLISTAEQSPSILATTVPWTDYELRLEFRMEAGGNSGIFLRSAPVPTDPAVDCYELNLCDAHPAFKTGSIVKRAQPIDVATADGGWHTLRAICEGNWIQAWIDDVHVTDFRDESAAPLLSGRIGLQQNGGTIEFRNVQLKPLSLRSLFDGSTLDGWNVVPGGKSQFEVLDGTIHVTNGPGFLETADVFGDFVLQAGFQSNGDGLNSGIFFRAMQGTAAAPSHGYEFQLHSGIKDGDPRQPVDAGTGAIFRRAAARRVMSRDREWNTVTLNAAGDRFATWVNGYPVVDWQDTREPDENPRKGRRLEPGHLSLQGHDPTTDVQFRGLRVGEHGR